MATSKKAPKRRHKSEVETEPVQYAPVLVMQQGGHPYPAQMSNGGIHSGASLIADASAIRDLAAAEWELRVQTEIDRVSEERTAAALAVDELEEAYQLAIGAIAFPSEFVSKVTALAEAHKSFFPSAEAFAADGKFPLAKLIPVADATQSLQGIATQIDQKGKKGTVTFSAVIKGKSDGTAGSYDGYGRSHMKVELYLNHSEPLAESVLVAYRALQEGREQVRELDASLIDLAKKKQTAPKIGTAAFAATASRVLSKTKEGQDLLNIASAAVDHFANKAKLPAGQSGGMIALTSKKPLPTDDDQTPAAQ